MSKLDLTVQASPRSRAWCSECSFKAWGIWAHVKAKAHHDEHVNSKPFHIVHVITPDA